MATKSSYPTAGAFTTVAEISVRAGVSKSTVSRALNGDPRISAKTRERITMLATEFGYAPNAIAQSLATKQSRIIGFIGSAVDNYWYQENIQIIAAAISQVGMQMMMFQVPLAGSVSDVVPEMIKYRLAGCVVIPTVSVDIATIERIERYGIHCVLINRAMEHASSVMCDQFGSAKALAMFLVMGGHERIAFVAGSTTPTALSREAGFLAALKEQGVELYHRVLGNYTFEDAYRAVASMLYRGVKPDAIFAANDLMAFGTIEALRSAGIGIPQEISVVGFDNSRIGDWPGFTLTTVAQPIHAIMDRAVAQIAGRQSGVVVSPEVTVLDGELIIRGSARIPSRLHEIGLPFSGRSTRTWSQDK